MEYKRSYAAWAVGLILGISHSAFSATEGSGHSGGGGSEVLFVGLSPQIQTWLDTYKADGTLAEKLNLAESGVSAYDVVTKYAKAVQDTPDVKSIPQSGLKKACQQGDRGACLLEEHSSRICVNHRADPSDAKDTNFIRCNSDLFDKARGDLQFTINFHEHLAIAGLEENGNGDIQSYSRFPISKYLMRFAAPQTVIKFVLGSEINKGIQLEPGASTRILPLEEIKVSHRARILALYINTDHGIRIEIPREDPRPGETKAEREKRRKDVERLHFYRGRGAEWNFPAIDHDEEASKKAVEDIHRLFWQAKLLRMSVAIDLKKLVEARKAIDADRFNDGKTQDYELIVQAFSLREREAGSPTEASTKAQ